MRHREGLVEAVGCWMAPIAVAVLAVGVVVVALLL